MTRLRSKQIDSYDDVDSGGGGVGGSEGGGIRKEILGDSISGGRKNGWLHRGVLVLIRSGW